MYTDQQDRMLQMLKATAPYAGARARVPIQLLIQAGELAYQLRHMPQEAELAACSMEDDRADVEGLLLQVQQLSTPRERETIQTMLNFVRAGKMMQAYQNFMLSHNYNDASSMQPENSKKTTPESNPSETSESNMDVAAASTGRSNSSSSLMMEFLLSQLSPEQRESLEMLKSVMEMQNLAANNQ